jgi:hypothetical protein
MDAAQLCMRLRRWRSRNWTAARVEATYAAIQRLADLAAAAEGRPPRPVPRHEAGPVLADQLAVLAHDVHRSADPTAAAAADAEIRTLATTLGF